MSREVDMDINTDVTVDVSFTKHLIYSHSFTALQFWNHLFPLKGESYVWYVAMLQSCKSIREHDPIRVDGESRTVSEPAL